MKSVLRRLQSVLLMSVLSSNCSAPLLVSRHMWVVFLRINNIIISFLQNDHVHSDKMFRIRNTSLIPEWRQLPVCLETVLLK